MLDERAEYIQIIKDLGGDTDGRQKALDFIRNSDVWVHGEPAPFPYVPYLMNAADIDYLWAQCKMAHGILCKVIQHYLNDESYRPIFNLPPEVEKLVLLPCGYDQLLPMGRFDLFLDENDLSYKFCEFNTDGSGAASRDYMIGRALMEGQTFKTFAKRHKVEQFELFDSWVRAFMRIYRSDRNVTGKGSGTAGLPENPTVCITDFRESGVFSDFDRFIAAFERAGIPCRFVDTREFEFDGEHLRDASDGTVIHAIYRRAVTSELLGHLDKCRPLIDAVAAQKVCLIGHFRTTVVHSKMVNVALFDESTRAFLTPEECRFVDEHVPRTYVLESGKPSDSAAASLGAASLDVAGSSAASSDAANLGTAGSSAASSHANGSATSSPTGINGFRIDEVKQNREEWIIKPADDYGGHGVYPGVDYTDEEWPAIVDANTDSGYIVQEFYPPRKVKIVDTKLDPKAVPEKNCKVEEWQSMPGIYMYDGEPVGFYCRLGQSGVIAIDHGGLCANTFKVDC